MKTYNEDKENLEPYTQQEIEEMKDTTYFSPLRFKRLLATLDRGENE